MRISRTSRGAARARMFGGRLGARPRAQTRPGRDSKSRFVGRAQRARHGHGLPRDQPRQQRTPIEQTGPTGVPLFSTYVEQLGPGAAAVIGTADAAIPSRACATFRPAITGCSRSSTSTRGSPAPTATPCGCTWISGKARTGSDRPANLRRADEDPHRSGVVDADHAGRGQGDSADRVPADTALVKASRSRARS